MPTLLVTAKMDPALAARIEAAVSGKRRKPGRSGLAPSLVSIARFGAIAALALVVYSVLGARRHEKQEIAQARSELLATVHKHSSALTETERSAVARDEAWLVAFSRGYDGETIAPELRGPGALTSAMARPLVYIRGPIGAFSSSRRIAEAATTSAKDALLLCLHERPASRDEKDLLPLVRVAYGTGAALEQRTANVRRLHEAEVGLPLLMPAWAARVENAPDLSELTKLRRELERAPIDAAKQAAKAQLLLVAMDEPGQGGGPTELDGERAHWIRIGLVDLTSEKLLLSTRKLVDPSWISASKKSEFAIGLDSCQLGFDVHATIAAPASAPRK
jgi:hypothetical protein